MAASFNVVLMLLFLAGTGGMEADLLSAISAEDYFKHHDVEVKVATMLDRAAKAPTDGPTQAAQLLAIRWLGEQPGSAKDKKVRDLLGAIAEGKQAQDAQGFARDYARIALTRLDGKPAPTMPLPVNSVREEALAWFPESARTAGAFDARGPASQTLDIGRMRQLVTARMPAESRTEIIKIIDQLGNVRVDRMSFAFVEADPSDAAKTSIWLRFTGKADHKRMVEMIRKNARGTQLQEEKGAKNEAISIVSAERQPPAFAVIGDTDLLICGASSDQGNHLAVLREVLEVRAGKKPSLLKGPLAALLKEVSADAVAAAVGEPSESQSRPFGLKAAPKSFVVQATRKGDPTGKIRLTFADADAAKNLVDMALAMKKQGEKQLDSIPAELKIPKETIAALKDALAATKIYADDKTVHMQGSFPASVLKTLPELLKDLLER